MQLYNGPTANSEVWHAPATTTACKFWNVLLPGSSGATCCYHPITGLCRRSKRLQPDFREHRFTGKWDLRIRPLQDIWRKRHWDIPGLSSLRSIQEIFCHRDKTRAQRRTQWCCNAAFISAVHAEKPSQALKAILLCCQMALFPVKLISLN